MEGNSLGLDFVTQTKLYPTDISGTVTGSGFTVEERLGGVTSQLSTTHATDCEEVRV